MTTGLRFALLGPIKAWRGDEEIPLGSPQQRATLSFLLLHEGKPVSVEEIIDAVWGESPPRDARGTVRTYVYRLRRTLGVITSVGGGYSMPVPAGSVDWDCFRLRVAAAREARGHGVLAEASELLRAADDLWCGSPLAGIRGDYVEQQRTRLAQARVAALEERLAIDLELGRHTAVTEELATAVVAEPMRERLRELLMTALFRSGRQAEALSVYDEGRRLLNEELGIDPGVGLRALHQRILRADLALAVPAPTASDHPPTQLPADLADFVGRTGELTEIRTLLESDDRAPVVAISGFVGMGKTALAVQAGRALRSRFPDGRLFVNLGASTTEPTSAESALRGFLCAFGVRGDQLPTELPDLIALWRTMLAERRVLVVLDDADDVDQVRHLLPTTPGSAAIVTGWRHLVHLPTARSIKLGPLPPADAVEMLARLTGRQRIMAERGTAERLLALCSFHPMGVRAIAARLLARPRWSVAELFEHASHGIADPVTLDDDCLPAYPRLRVVLAKLDPVQATVFRLAALSGQDLLTADAVAALVDLPRARTARLLESLVDANLLEAGRQGTYRYLDVAKTYARREALRHDGAAVCTTALQRLTAHHRETDLRFVLNRLDARPGVRKSVARCGC